MYFSQLIFLTALLDQLVTRRQSTLSNINILVSNHPPLMSSISTQPGITSLSAEDIDVTAYILAQPQVQIPKGPLDAARSPARRPHNPARLYDNIVINVAVDVDDMPVEEPQSETVLLGTCCPLNHAPWFSNLLTQFRKPGRKVMVVTRTKHNRVLLHYNAGLEVDRQLQEAQKENDALEDRDVNIIAMTHISFPISVDPPIKLPPPLDKGAPMFEQVHTHGNW
jgi:hypothetical protein